MPQVQRKAPKVARIPCDDCSCLFYSTGGLLDHRNAMHIQPNLHFLGNPRSPSPVRSQNGADDLFRPDIQISPDFQNNNPPDGNRPQSHQEYHSLLDGTVIVVICLLF